MTDSGGQDAPTPSQLDASTDAAVAAVRALTLASARFRQMVAAHIGVDISATMAMSHLSTSGPLSPRELAGRVGVTPSSMTALLDRLENARLAARAPHPTDRRKTVVTLTDSGQATLVRVRKRLRSALAAFSDDRLDDVAEVIRTLAEALNAQAQALQNRDTL